MLRRLLYLLAAITAFSGTTLPAQAQSATESPYRSGNMEVHYAVRNSMFLQPAVAAQNNLVRDGKTGLITLTVRDRKQNTAVQNAAIEVQVKTLLGTSVPVTRKSNQGADYYLAQFPITQRETLILDFSIRIPGETAKSFSFHQEVFPE